MCRGHDGDREWIGPRDFFVRERVTQRSRCFDQECSKRYLLEARFRRGFDCVDLDRSDGLRRCIVVTPVARVLEQGVFRRELVEILRPVDERDAELYIRCGGYGLKRGFDTLKGQRGEQKSEKN